MKNKNNQLEKFSNFVIFQTETGKVNIEVFVKDESAWLTQKAMGQLFGVESHTITYHLKEIYKTGELKEKATTRIIRAVRKEGSRTVSRDSWDMKRFYERYQNAPEKLRRSVALLPWGHNLQTMIKTKSNEEAFFYAEKTIQRGWTKELLLNYIKADDYQLEADTENLITLIWLYQTIYQTKHQKFLKANIISVFWQ